MSTPDPGPPPPVPPGWSSTQPGPWQSPTASPSPTAPPSVSPATYGTVGGFPAAPPLAYGPPPGAYAPYGPPPQAPKPGIVPLRPLGLGEILDGSVSYLRFSAGTVFPIAAAMALLTALLQFVALFIVYGSLQGAAAGSGSLFDPGNSLGTSSGADLDQQLALNLGTTIAALLSALVGVVATGLLTLVVAYAVLGRRLSVADTWERVRPQILALFGTVLLFGAIMVGIFAAVVGVVAVLVVTLDGVGIAIGVVLAIASIPLFVWLWVQWSLASCACVLEKAGPVTALRRSAFLVRTQWWRIFGISLLAHIVIQIIVSIVAFPFTIVGVVLSVSALADGRTPVWLLAFSILGTLFSTLLSYPLLSGVTALLYLDARMRREGFDFALRQSAGVAAATGAGPAPGGPVWHPDAAPGDEAQPQGRAW